MAWARIDDGFDDHPKLLALLDAEEGAVTAVGLWTLCLTWAHRNTRKKGKTPGLIPAGLPRRFLGVEGRTVAKLLVAHGLWDEVPDGWLIHDFVDYLPSDETREARSAAGKRGAAKRWADKHAQDDGNAETNEKQDDGKLPSGCHDDASNAVATDGSRAGAHRAIPNGIAPTPTPSPGPKTEELPLPSEAGTAKPRPAESKPKRRAGSKPRPPAGNAADIIAAYVDGARDAGLPTPAESLRARVGKQGRELLAQDVALDALAGAARRMGAIGWHDLAVQVQRDAANERASPPSNGHTAYQNPDDQSVYDEDL